MGVAGRKMPTRQSTCAQCGKPIEPPKLAYCSKECQVKANRIAAKESTRKTREQEMKNCVPESFEGEIWRPIEGFDGEYEVSNYGRVRTLNFFRRTKDGKWYPVKARILKQYNQKGYLHVNLARNGHYKRFRVHRLVACAFIPKIDGKTDVNHIDGNKQNNNAENLEWCTPSENIRHAFEHGLMHLSDPETRVRARRKPVIRDDGITFKSMTDMAKDIDRTTGTACRYLKDKGKVAPNGHRYRYMNAEEIRTISERLYSNEAILNDVSDNRGQAPESRRADTAVRA